MSKIEQKSAPEEFLEMKKLNRINLLSFLRGPERIRTAVAAFAELSLATRPQDPLTFQSLAKVQLLVK
jgi:hypothetical protein